MADWLVKAASSGNPARFTVTLRLTAVTCGSCSLLTIPAPALSIGSGVMGVSSRARTHGMEVALINGGSKVGADNVAAGSGGNGAKSMSPDCRRFAMPSLAVVSVRQAAPSQKSQLTSDLSLFPVFNVKFNVNFC